ncbi:MAG: hypothetical protein HY516_01980 [Candidatus Aenigmarchaeota archaeon]|nr:hypothetical protein [Candidatus Aenigmarchaeota archaeon]
MKLAYLISLAMVLLAGSFAAGQAGTNYTALLAQAENEIKEMSDAGFGVAFVSDALLDARKAFNATVYSIVTEKAGLISDRKLQAYNISDSITALALGIEDVRSYGLNTSDVEEVLGKSRTAFQQERYEEAEKLIKQGYAELTSVRAEATIVQIRIKAARENLISFVKDNQNTIIAGVFIAALTSFVVFARITEMRTKNRIKNLAIEKTVLKGLMKKAQYDHFQKRTLTREGYGIKMEKYRERVLEIKRLIPVLRSRLKKRLPPKHKAKAGQ